MDEQKKYEVIKSLAELPDGNKDRAALTRLAILDLCRTKYYDANFQHFSELLESQEQIVVSASCVADILEEQYILSPKVTRAKRKLKRLPVPFSLKLKKGFGH